MPDASRDPTVAFLGPHPVAGRIVHFRENWDRFNPNKWVKNVLQHGYQIPFIQVPKFQGIKKTPLSGVYAQVLMDEVASLLDKGAIEEIQGRPQDGYFSKYFLVPKKTGDLRPILNLKPINSDIQKKSFKMENLNLVIEALHPGNWLAAIDLKDAYFHVPIHTSHYKYLRFAIQNKMYQYKVLPFGLTTSPRVFTKILAPVMGFLASNGIQVHPYLDDILIVAQSKALLQQQVSVVQEVLMLAGYIINVKKSHLQPCQDLVFLGARFLTSQNLVCLPVEKVNKIVSMVLRFKVSVYLTARVWLQLLGLFASTIFIVDMARLYLRPIQLYVNQNWNYQRNNLNHKLLVTNKVYHHLQWWRDPHNLSLGMPLSPRPVSAVIMTDASLSGWGGILTEVDGASVKHMVQGVWNPSQAAYHINVLELLAVRNTLVQFRSQLVNRTVMVRSDNTTVCTYINKMGGTKSPHLCHLTMDLWIWCQNNNIKIRSLHVPGDDNQLADVLSRHSLQSKEWGLNPRVVNWLFTVWDRPVLDLFASIHNKKLQNFATFYHCPQAVVRDAFSINWGIYPLLYAFPPVVLLHRVVKKIIQDQARVVLIAPRWPQRGWFAKLLNLLVEVPLQLPLWPDLLLQGKFLHPDPGEFDLVAWRVSGVTSESEAFRKKLRTRFSTQGSRPPKHATMLSGSNTVIGVVQGLSIPLRPLSS